MCRLERLFPDPLQQSKSADCAPRLLTANDWKSCIQDDCASWELFCLVRTDERSHASVFPKPILIRVEFAGELEAFDRDRWTGLLETIERDFACAKYESELLAASASQGKRPWRQWVITPRPPLIQMRQAQ